MRCGCRPVDGNIFGLENTVDAFGDACIVVDQQRAHVQGAQYDKSGGSARTIATYLEASNCNRYRRWLSQGIAAPQIVSM